MKLAILGLVLVATAVGPGTIAKPLPSPKALPTQKTVVSPKCATHDPVQLFVRVGRKGGDGSSKRPLGSIAAALREAEKRRLCNLVVEAGGGEYPQPLTVRLPRVRIKSKAGQRAVVRATIDNTKGSRLELSGIDVRRAQGVGVRQVGGRLSMTGVRVVETGVVATEMNSGVGLWASGGAEVVLKLCAFERNAGHGLRAEGAGTRVWANGASVLKTGLHPLVRERIASNRGALDLDIGAIVVSRDASAWFRTLTVKDNLVASLTVSSGAKVRIERSKIHNTIAPDSALGGMGIVVRNDGVLESIRTTVNKSVTCGVAVRRGYATLRGGVIARAAVGACVTAPKMSTTCLRKGVRYVKVGVPLVADHYTIGPDERTTCPSVPATPLPRWPS